MRFRQKIKEAIARTEMPQIKTRQLPAAIAKLQELGLDCSVGVVECSKLKPMQDGVIRDKVESIKERIGAGDDMGPIVISREGYIVDGHHRWVATQEACGKDHKINAIKMDLPKNEAKNVLDMVENELSEQTLVERAGRVALVFWVTYDTGDFEKGAKPRVIGTYHDENEAKRMAQKNDLGWTKIETFVER